MVDNPMSKPRPRLAGGWLSVALIACGIFAGSTIVGHRPGLGVAVAGLVMVVIVAAARPTRPSPASLVAAGLAVVLLSFAVILDAGWVIAFDLTFALILGSYAVAGGEAFAEVMNGCTAVVTRLGSGLQVAFGPIERAAAGVAQGRARGYAVGASAAGVLIVVFGALFVSADPAFSRAAQRILTPDLGADLLPARVAVALSVALLGGAFVAAGRRNNPPSDDPFGEIDRVPSWRARRADWVIPLAALNGLFAAFIGIHLSVLFGGRDHVMETTGLSYAEYARQGFFQLVLVSILTLILVAAAVRWSAIDSRTDRIVMQVLLGLLCLLTLALLASALKRLSLYEEAFGLTRLRISVHATILWLGGTFAMLLVAGAMWNATWLARAALFFTAIGLVTFSAVDPDASIARQNVDRYVTTGEIDPYYLSTLSADAVPELTRLPEPARSCLLGIHARNDYDASWPAFNISRRRAKDVLERSRADPIVCPAIADVTK